MNPVSWFEIPVDDLDRAVSFYSVVFEIEFEITEIDGHSMALFPSHESAFGCSGALAHGESYAPSLNGPRVDFDVADVQAVIPKLSNLVRNCSTLSLR